MLRRYIVERDMPGVGTLSAEDLCGAAAQSNQALDQLAPRVQWAESFVAADRTFCIYLAENEDVIRRHGEMSGFPVTRVFEVPRIIDPTTANA